MMHWLKQPWVQALIAIAVLLLIVVGAYYYGKSAGRAATSKEFEMRQAELLRKSQEALLLADKHSKRADELEVYALKLKDTIELDRKSAEKKELQLTNTYDSSMSELQRRYEDEKSSILNSNVSDCDRCRDVCRRAEELAKYGAEFASLACTPESCGDACTN